MNPSISISLAAAAVAAFALLTSLLAIAKLRGLKRDQSVLLASGNEEDLIGKAAATERLLGSLTERADQRESFEDNRFAELGSAVSESLSGFSLVRYDAFDEASGQQSFSIALVNSERSGVVISSLARRDSVRIYAQTVERGQGERDLSPEEQQAVDKAASGRTGR